ncbi:hypothetical protein [Methylobacterium sp. Leaf117]|uniref:hypothetical protein n=1 Tax=Methylobacterium sp. Leaf117 TaxID=1736260 RepID=UPI0006FBE64B|nr:hypothetical protein [Methylobacterium sp. Leaf117]KQP96563.1 hypothetical protein ASF57_02135 [Methylobacterium sp. Leaf117]
MSRLEVERPKNPPEDEKPSEDKNPREDKLSEAKMALQRAIDLNAEGDPFCRDAVADPRKLRPHKGR